MLVHHKWFIRAGLAMFWVAEVIAWFANYGFITYLLTNHLWVMLIIIFFSFKYMLEPFYASFFTRTTKGGEIMQKSTWLMLILAAGLGTLVVAMALEPSRTAILNGLQYGVFNNVYYAGVGFNDWLGTFPALWALGSGLLGGLLLAVVVNTLVRPRMPFTHKTSQTPSSTIHRTSTTPANATTRPEPLPVQKVEIEVKTNPQPVEATKEETVTA